MTVSFRLYGYLNDFLPPFRRGFRFRQILGTHWSVRDAPSTSATSCAQDGEPVETQARWYNSVSLEAKRAQSGSYESALCDRDGLVWY